MTNILVIAGTDSSGGAGLTRDAAIAGELGFRVMPAVTSVTAQTDDALHLCHPVPPRAVTAQIEAAFAGTPPDAVKIGMLGTGRVAEAVAEALAPRQVPVVLDPVLRASSGGALFSGGGLRRLFPMVTLLTPNLDEAAALAGRPKAESEEEIAAQAGMLRGQGARAVLIKGGHGEGALCTDHLFGASGHRLFSAPRSAGARRGTGCALATAIACHLAAGRPLDDACHRGIGRIRQWIADR